MFPGRPLSLVFLLLLASVTFAQDPVAAPATGPAPFTRSRPRIASDGRDFLAVWSDGRAGTVYTDVRAARIDASGAVLDPLGIAIKPLGYTAQDVASNGDGYLVASTTGRTTELSHVDASGTVRDAARLADAIAPALASNGRDYLLVFQRGFGPAIQDYDIYAQRLSGDGSLLGEPLRVTSDAVDPIVASNGRDYAVGWFDITGSYATIVSDNGIRVPAVQITAGGLQPYAGRDKMSVASDGTDFLFVWAEGRGLLNGNTWRMQTFARRLRANGSLDAQQQFFPDEAPVQGDPSVIWIGDRYFVTFTSNLQRTDPDIAAVEADRDGARLREPFTLAALSARQTMSDVAWNGRDTEVVFVDTVRFVINEAGTKSDDIRHIRYGEAESELLSQSLAWQGPPAAAAQGDGNVVVWTEQAGREHVSRLFAGRARAGTGPISGRGDAVHISENDQLSPALSDAPEPVAVWIELPPTGPALVYARPPFGSTTPWLLGEAARTARPAITWSGSLHFVVWETPAHRIVGMHLTADGRPLGTTPIEITPTGVTAIDPQIVANPERAFLTWTTFQFDDLCVIIECPSFTVFNVQALDSAFQPLAPPAVLARGRLTRPRLALNGDELAVFFAGTELTSAGDRGGLRAVRVDRNGIPLDAEGRLLAPAATAVTSALWDGTAYDVAAQTNAAPIIVRATRDLRPLSTSTLEGPNVVITPHGNAIDLIYQKREDVMRLYLWRWPLEGVTRRRAR